MFHLASCSYHLIHEVTLKAPRMAAVAKSGLPPLNPLQCFSHLSAISFKTLTSPSFQVPSPFWQLQLAINTNSDASVLNYLESHIDYVSAGNGGIPNDYYRMESATGNLSEKAGIRFSSLSVFPVKTCHYFKFQQRVL